MPSARRIRWMTLCHPLFFFILLAFGPGAGWTFAQTQPQNPLGGKNVLILPAFESMVSIFEKTNQGLSAALQYGGIGIRNQFYEHLELRRNSDPEHSKLMVELMRQRYGRRKFDFMVLTTAFRKDMTGKYHPTLKTRHHQEKVYDSRFVDIRNFPSGLTDRTYRSLSQ